MSTLSTAQSLAYPDSDGRPMADNTKQFRWIVYIKEGLEWLFAEDPNVFVAGDLLWYPVEGQPPIRQAPDVLVVFGRPKGDRGSYQQWREGDLPPQVVFEVLSPGNTLTEMAKKLEFYERYGVEEYYLYDPDKVDLSGWVRTGEALVVIDKMEGWISPRLQVRFGLSPAGELQLLRPDGQSFESYGQIARRAEQERQRAEQERQRAERLAEKLREMGVDPDGL